MMLARLLAPCSEEIQRNLNGRGRVGDRGHIALAHWQNETSPLLLRDFESWTSYLTQALGYVSDPRTERPPTQAASRDAGLQAKQTGEQVLNARPR